MSFFFLRMESHIEAIYTLEMLIRFTTELHYTVKHFVYNFEPKQILFQKQMVGNSSHKVTTFENRILQLQ